jgi:hypothetical protein
VKNEAGEMNSDEMNAKWMAYMTPGQEHEMLNNQSGNWSEEITIWSHEGAEPMLSSAKVQIEMILEGRYQQSTPRRGICRNAVSWNWVSCI